MKNVIISFLLDIVGNIVSTLYFSFLVTKTIEWLIMPFYSFKFEGIYQVIGLAFLFRFLVAFGVIVVNKSILFKDGDQKTIPPEMVFIFLFLYNIKIYIIKLILGF